MKTTTATTVKDVKGNQALKAKQKLQAAHSVDDAVRLFLARWADADE